MSKIPEKSLWNGNSDLQDLYNRLSVLIPVMGEVENPRKNPMLEKLRRASNCYYDLYNNGLCNRAMEFRQVLGIASSKYRLTFPRRSFQAELYEATEKRMNHIIRCAALEQGLVARPVTG